MANQLHAVLGVEGLDDGSLILTSGEYPDVVAELAFAGAAFEPLQRQYAWAMAAAPRMVALMREYMEENDRCDCYERSGQLMKCWTCQFRDVVKEATPPEQRAVSSPDA